MGKAPVETPLDSQAYEKTILVYHEAAGILFRYGNFALSMSIET